MEYYLFDATDEVVANSITDSSLVPLSRYGKTPKFWDNVERLVHVPFLDGEPDILSEEQLPDLLGVGVEIVVSKATAECLRCFAHDEASLFLPVSVVNRAANIITNDYFLVASQSWCNVLDLNQAKLDFHFN